MLDPRGITCKADLDKHFGFSGILAAIRHAVNALVHTTTRATPSQLVFGRDKLLNVNFVADWQCIKDRKQRLILQNNKRETRHASHTSMTKAIALWSNSTPRANTMVTNTRALMRLLRHMTTAPSSSQGTPMVELSTRHGISGMLIPIWTDHPNAAARSFGANHFSPTQSS